MLFTHLLMVARFSIPGFPGHQQVSRLGMPLVNEVVIPLSHKDRFNASHLSRISSS